MSCNGVSTTECKQESPEWPEPSEEAIVFLTACAEKSLKTIETLIKKGALVNVRSQDGTTPLHIAAKRGFFEIVVLLLKNGADHSARNIHGDIPVMLTTNRKILTILSRARQGLSLEA